MDSFPLADFPLLIRLISVKLEENPGHMHLYFKEGYVHPGLARIRQIRLLRRVCKLESPCRAKRLRQ